MKPNKCHRIGEPNKPTNQNPPPSPKAHIRRHQQNNHNKLQQQINQCKRGGAGERRGHRTSTATVDQIGYIINCQYIKSSDAFRNKQKKTKNFLFQCPTMTSCMSFSYTSMNELVNQLINYYTVHHEGAPFELYCRFNKETPTTIKATILNASCNKRGLHLAPPRHTLFATRSVCVGHLYMNKYVNGECFLACSR